MLVGLAAAAVATLVVGWSICRVWTARRGTTADSRLRTIADLSTQAVVAVNDRWEIATWNVGAERMFGWSQDDAVGSSVWEIVPDAVDRAYAGFFEQLATGEVQLPDAPIEMTVARRDGSNFLAELSITGMDEGGRIFLVVFIRDISRQRRDELEMLAAKQFSEGLLNAATGYAIIATDSTGIITVFNRGAERMLGYPASELIGRETIDIVHDAGELNACAIEFGVEPGPFAVLASASNGVADTREWTYVAKNGTRIPALVTVNTVPSSPGSFPGYILIAHDVSAQRRAERRLQFANEAFRKAFEATPSGMVLMRPDMTCLHANPAYCEMTGFNAERLRGVPMIDLCVTTADTASPAEQLAHSADGVLQLRRDERTIRRADGSEFVAAVGTSAIFDDHGEVALIVSHVEDITDRLRREADERELLARKSEALAQLEELDAAKDQFISSVSHELRTPLSSIVGYTELLQDGAMGPLLPKHLEALGLIERSARRLEQLIDDLTTLSKLDNAPGGGGAHRDLVDVAAAAHNAAATLLPMFDKRSQRLVLSIDDSAGCVVGDDRQLEHAVTNLLTNAGKFTPDGGGIELRVRRDRDLLIVEVEDDGVGIPADEQERVFSRFFRSERAEIENIQGTGLGLAIVQSIVEQHGGHVSLESELGRGTTVRIVLPRVPRQSERHVSV